MSAPCQHVVFVDGVNKGPMLAGDIAQLYMDSGLEVPQHFQFTPQPKTIYLRNIGCDADDVITLIKSDPYIEDLLIKECDQITDESLDTLSMFSQLKRLRVDKRMFSEQVYKSLKQKNIIVEQTKK